MFLPLWAGDSEPGVSVCVSSSKAGDSEPGVSVCVSPSNAGDSEHGHIC